MLRYFSQNHRHESYGLLHKPVQRKELHDRLEQFGHTVPVGSKQTPGHAGCGKVSVADNQFITMAHLHHHFQQLWAENRRNSV
jgi:hypothetical protein